MEKRDYHKEPVRLFIAVDYARSSSGAVCGNLPEADCNLAIAMLMDYELRRHGVQVTLSRCQNEEDCLSKEIAACNTYAPDFAIALQTNISDDSQASGFAVYHQLKSWMNSKFSVKMAELFDQKISKYLNVTTRGLKTNNQLDWLQQIEAPCILVEDVIVNEPKAQWYSAPAQLEKLSKAYVSAILEFFGIPYRSDEIQTLRYKIVEDNLISAKDYNCTALFANGSHYVHLQQFVNTMGLAVYYNPKSKKTILYSPTNFVEVDFQDCLLKLSDFPSEAERILKGIPTKNVVEMQ